MKFLKILIMVGLINIMFVAQIFAAESSPIKKFEEKNGKNMDDIAQIQEGSLIDASKATRVDVESGRIYIRVNNKTIYPEANPFIENERTMVPLRAIAEALGSQVSWDPEKYEITILKKDKKIWLKIGDTNASLNGTPISIDTPPLIKDNVTFVPVRFIAESFGAKVDWDPTYVSVAYLVDIKLTD